MRIIYAILSILGWSWCLVAFVYLGVRLYWKRAAAGGGAVPVDVKQQGNPDA